MPRPLFSAVFSSEFYARLQISHFSSFSYGPATDAPQARKRGEAEPTAGRASAEPEI